MLFIVSVAACSSRSSSNILSMGVNMVSIGEEDPRKGVNAVCKMVTRGLIKDGRGLGD